MIPNHNTVGCTWNVTISAYEGGAECTASIELIKANTGFLNTVYAFAMLVSSFWMPVFSDSFGRKEAIM